MEEENDHEGASNHQALSNGPAGPGMERRRVVPNEKLGYALAMIVLLGNGTQSVINNGRPMDLDSSLFTLVTVIVECICILPISMIEQARHGQPVSNFAGTRRAWREHWWRFLLVGLIFAVATYLVILGYSSIKTEAGNRDSIAGAVVVRLQPISMYIIGALFLKERVSWKEVVFSAIMLVSVYYMGTKGTWLLDSLSIGVVYLLVAPVLWNVGHSLVKPLLRGQVVSTPQIIFIRTGISSIILAAGYLAIFGTGSLWQVLHPDYFTFMLLMGLNYTVLHIFWYKTISNLDLTTATAFIIPAPVVTTILAMAFLGEVPFMYHFVGMAGCFLGLYGLLYVKLKETRKETRKEIAGGKD